MRSFISLSILTATLLVPLALFLFLTPTSHVDMSATVVEAPAPADNKAPEPALVTESTTTATSTPTVIPADKPKEIIATPKQPIATTATKPQAPTQSLPTPTDLVNLIHSLTNAAREQNNLADLTFDTRFSALAKERSQDMINQNYFSHTSLSGCDLHCRFANSNYKTLTWGENLAESTSYNMLSTQELADMFMESWLRSSGHRDNLLSKKFTHEGIGVAIKGNRVVVTVIFAAP